MADEVQRVFVASVVEEDGNSLALGVLLDRGNRLASFEDFSQKERPDVTDIFKRRRLGYRCHR